MTTIKLSNGYTANLTPHRLYTTVELLLSGKVVATTTAPDHMAKGAAELLVWRHQNKRPPQQEKEDRRVQDNYLKEVRAGVPTGKVRAKKGSVRK